MVVGEVPTQRCHTLSTLIFFKETKMLWILPSEPKENEEENTKRRKVEVLRLGLLSSALTLQRKRMQFDNLQKKSFMVQISVRHCKKVQKVPYTSVLESQN